MVNWAENRNSCHFDWIFWLHQMGNEPSSCSFRPQGVLLLGPFYWLELGARPAMQWGRTFMAAMSRVLLSARGCTTWSRCLSHSARLCGISGPWMDVGQIIMFAPSFCVVMKAAFATVLIMAWCGSMEYVFRSLTVYRPHSIISLQMMAPLQIRAKRVPPSAARYPIWWKDREGGGRASKQASKQQ